MAFWVAKSRLIRLLGLYPSSGKHAAPRVTVQLVPPDTTTEGARRPAHAAWMPRLTGPHAGGKKAA
jgi:hypothetical protein